MICRRAADRFYMQLSQYKSIFNLTMTYRLDSDLPWVYGQIQDLETSKIIAPKLHVNWRKPTNNFTGL